MKPSGMRWIIPAVIVAITALVVFQVQWLMHEAERKKDDEKRRVGEALRATCVTMEELEARGFIGNSLDSVLVRPDHFPEEDSLNRLLFFEDAMLDSLDTLSPWDIVPPAAPPHPDDSLVHIPPAPPPPPHAERFVRRTHRGTFATESGRRATEVLVMQREQRIRSAMENVMMAYVFKTDAPPVLDTVLLDSVLNVKLQEQGIRYRYSRAVLGDPEEIRLYNEHTPAAAQPGWEFRAKLYAGVPDPFSPQIVVNVDPGISSVFMRILPQILFAFLITGGMLALFLMIYREALRQKKISEIRRDFINNMTHEFKTPLATMSLAADTIMNEKVVGDKDKVRYYAEQIKSENRKLNQQVEKVLELALMEKTGVVMNKEQVNLSELVLHAIKSMQLLVEAKGGSLTLDSNPQETFIEADPFHLERVFVNLLDNALKYGGTPPAISVSMEYRSNATEITISDNGAGIASSDWELIFEPFHRVPTGDVHNVKGFGLGLSYAKSVIAAHGGSISVSKSNASGTTFTVIIRNT